MGHSSLPEFKNYVMSSILPETESWALYIDWNCFWNSVRILSGFVVKSVLTVLVGGEVELSISSKVLWSLETLL